jgi:arylsulfatase A-like enzyme/Flp pilus assembly protein TadD
MIIMRIHYFIISALAGAFLFLPSCSRTVPPSVPHAPHVLILTVDTLRADRTGIGGYPVLSKTPCIDTMANTGMRFSRAYTTVPLTLPSHASLMTGLHPIQLGVHNNSPVKVPGAVTTLSEYFKSNGYQTCAAVSASVLYPETGIDQGFSRYDASFGRKRPSVSSHVKTYLLAERRAEDTVKAAQNLLETSDPGKPLFLWIHLYDPHDPFIPPPGYTHPGEHPYDGEVRYADEWTGKLFNSWRDFCGSNTNIVVIASDHGEGLGDHGEDYHGLFLYDTTLHVPLAICGTGITAGENHGQACLYDIFPTLLSYCGVPADYDGPGIDLLAGQEREVPVISETLYPESLGIRVSRGYTVRDETNKLILQPGPWLFTSSNKPAESVAVKNNTTAAPLKTVLEETVQLLARHSLGPEADEHMRTQTLEAIVSLGYIGSAAVTVEPDAPLFPHPDWPAPMAMTGYIARFEMVRRTPDVRTRLQVLQELHTADPEAEYVNAHLGEVYTVLGRIRQAATFFDRISISNACHAPLLHTMTLVYIKTGNMERALQCARQAVSLMPDKSSSYDAMAAALGAAGQLERARTCAEKAIELEPDNHFAWNTAGYIAFRLQKYTRASNMFHTAIILSGTNDVESLGNYVTVCRKLGDTNQAAWAEQQVQHVRKIKRK